MENSLSLFAATRLLKMIAFASFPPPPDDVHARDGVRHRREAVVDDDDEYDMELDFDDDDFASGSKLTCPGETLTSSHAFMRYAPSEYPPLPPLQTGSPCSPVAATAPTLTTNRS